MNVARLSWAFQRSYSTVRPFVPPSQLHDLGPPRLGPSTGRGGRRRRRTNEEDDDDRDMFARRNNVDGVKTMPESSTFYTSRSLYYDQLLELQRANAQARGALKALQLLPLPKFARDSLPRVPTVWKDQDEMSADFQSRLTTTRYRRVTSLLSELNTYHNIANTAGCSDLAQTIGQIISMFESRKKEAVLARGVRKKATLDEFGRSYTVGKRKTSSARVWMIPTKEQPIPSQASELEAMYNIQRSSLTATTILVNNIPLAEYFVHPADREHIVRPLKIAGVLGAYNVFAIVRGGGTTGQSGALAHGIARGLVTHEPHLETLLRKAKLTRRDPRMVERKKTGLAKARKRYTWVKR